MWVKMRDVAKAANVSVMTVSRAFKTPERVSADTRMTIFAVAERLGYVPNLVAGNLSSGRSHVVAAIIPSLRNSNYASMLEGLESGLVEVGYSMMLARGETPAKEAEAVQAFLKHRPEGFVLVGREHSPELRKLRRSPVPVVETFESEGPMLGMGVGFSQFDALREMTRLHIANGHRIIGFAGYATQGVNRFADRSRGFVAAMREAGLCDDLLAFETGADGGFSAGRSALQMLVEKAPGMTALVCATDIIAAGALFECYRRRWHVPERMAISGFGHYEIAGELPQRLTTIRSHAFEIGYHAAKLISDHHASKSTPNPFIDVGFEIVAGETAGPGKAV